MIRTILYLENHIGLVIFLTASKIIISIKTKIVQSPLKKLNVSSLKINISHNFKARGKFIKQFA